MGEQKSKRVKIPSHHFLFRHLHVLHRAHHATFQFGRTVRVFPLVQLASNIASFWIFSFLLISCWGVAIILLFIISFILSVAKTAFVPLVQLLLHLLIALGESLNYCGKGLHLPFQCIGGVSSLLVNGSNRSHLDHATLCLRNGYTANHSSSQMSLTDDAQKLSVS